MSDFIYATRLMLEAEGGYVNDPHDPGGETYKGVSRKHHPDWAGWRTIDVEKNLPAFPANLDRNPTLQSQVNDLYYRYYWKPAKCDMFPWPVNILVFDAAVNQGVKTAILVLQKSLRVAKDGIVGKQTLRAIAKVNAVQLSALYLADRALRYVGTRNFDRYGRGWFKRLFNLAMEVQQR